MKECCNECGKEMKNVVYEFDVHTRKHIRASTFYNNLGLGLNVRAWRLTPKKTISMVICGECIVQFFLGTKEKARSPEKLSGHCSICNKDFTTTSASYSREKPFRGNCPSCTHYGVRMS